MLLVGAVLFAQSFIRAQGEDAGYAAQEPGHRRSRASESSVSRSCRDGKVFPRSQRPRRPAAWRRGVGGITDFFIRRNAGQWVTIEGRAAARDEAKPRLTIEGVTPGYFRAVGIDLLEGRDFDERDYQPGAAGVFIVSEALAHRSWPGESAVGKRVVSGESPPKDGRWSTVVGVVRDIRREGLDVAPVLGAFIPAFPRGMDLTIRAATGLDTLIPAIRQELRSIDSRCQSRVATAHGQLSERLGARRFESQALGAFSGIALLLSAAGLYALLAYQVTLRRREIGIRSALGADRPLIVRMILGQGVRLALAGAAVGVAGAAASARVLQSLLYQTAALNAPSYAAAAVLVLLVAATAAWVPALRAARVSPMTALRRRLRPEQGHPALGPRLM